MSIIIIFSFPLIRRDFRWLTGPDPDHPTVQPVLWFNNKLTPEVRETGGNMTACTEERIFLLLLSKLVVMSLLFCCCQWYCQQFLLLLGKWFLHC